MASSSSSSSSYQDALVDPLFHCHPPHPTKLRVSWRPGNPARRFWNCRFSMSQNRPHYHFFGWLDPELNDHYKDIIRQLRLNANVVAVERAQRKLEVAEEKLKSLNLELGAMIVGRTKDKEKADVTVAVLKKDVEALQMRGKVY